MNAKKNLKTKRTACATVLMYEMLWLSEGTWGWSLRLEYYLSESSTGWKVEIPLPQQSSCVNQIVSHLCFKCLNGFLMHFKKFQSFHHDLGSLKCSGFCLPSCDTLFLSLLLFGYVVVPLPLPRTLQTHLQILFPVPRSFF